MHSHSQAAPPRITVIVPTFNEEERIEPLLQQLREQGPDLELLVADGGSTDATARIAERWARVLPGPKGRARQMNAAAAHARGDVLWFVHADSVLPEDAVAQVRHAMEDARLAGGCFRLAIPAGGLAYRICDRWGNLGVDLFKLACGDHGIFVRRSAFEAVGGYPEVSLFEDVELYRRMRRYGRVRQLRPAIQTSPRRWEDHGPWRVTRTYLLLWALYLGGASMETLERVYRNVSRRINEQKESGSPGLTFRP
ncbi:MAG: TIGR04283 family arsenosugar biosynthesis glycosyltransferase [Armatimonadetes bacterium]|nr:TIGR04283 family arsenosugar biosynthesis glycosyltransferase [Armatimonadota bacterium]